MDAMEPSSAVHDQATAPVSGSSVTQSDVSATHGELTGREVAILDFERQWWRHPGSKEQAIRDRFNLSPTRYYQLLNALIDNPQALRHDPMLVKRLRRLRARRSRARAPRHPEATAGIG